MNPQFCTVKSVNLNMGAIAIIGLLQKCNLISQKSITLTLLAKSKGKNMYFLGHIRTCKKQKTSPTSLCQPIRRFGNQTHSSGEVSGFICGKYLRTQILKERGVWREALDSSRELLCSPLSWRTCAHKHKVNKTSCSPHCSILGKPD